MDTGWPVKDVTQRMYDQLEPVAGSDPALGWPLLAFIDALGQMPQPVADIIQDGDNGEPGWSVILDVERIPDVGLTYLAQFVGMWFLQGDNPPAQRQALRDLVSWQRGTPAAISAGVARFLTGTKTVQLTERNGSPYKFTIIIWSAEAPADTSPTSPLVKYINLYVKPAGLQWTLTINPGSPPAVTYNQLYVRPETYATIYSKFQTYADIR